MMKKVVFAAFVAACGVSVSFGEQKDCKLNPAECSCEKLCKQGQQFYSVNDVYINKPEQKQE